MLLRYSVVTNPSDTESLSPSALADCGIDCAVRWIVRPLSAADIGPGVGKVQNVNGCVVATFPDGKIQDAILFPVQRALGNRVQQLWNQEYISTGTIPNDWDKPYKISWRISTNGKTLSIKDATSTVTEIGDHQLSALDNLKFLVLTRVP